MLLEFNLKPIFVPEIRFAGQEVLTNFKKGGERKPLIFKYLAIGKIVVFSSYKTNIRLGPGFQASFLFLISSG